MMLKYTTGNWRRQFFKKTIFQWLSLLFLRRSLSTKEKNKPGRDLSTSLKKKRLIVQDNCKKLYHSETVIIWKASFTDLCSM